MPFAFHICAGITALLLIFELAQIVAALGNIRETLDIIHRDLCRIHDDLVLLFGKGKVDKMGDNPIVLFNENPPKKKDRTETTKRYNRTHRLVLDRKLGKHRWVKKSECHRELNLATGKEIWVANA